MALETKLKEICKICGEDFMRPRRALDNLGIPDLDKICPKCLSATEDGTPVVKIIKQPKIEPSKKKKK